MVRIKRQRSSDMKAIFIKYGFPFAPYHQCSHILYDLVGHEVDPVPIPQFDDENDVHDALKEIQKLKWAKYVELEYII